MKAGAFPKVDYLEPRRLFGLGADGSFEDLSRDGALSFLREAPIFQSLVRYDRALRLGAGGRSTLILDFGEELCGGLRLVVGQVSRVSPPRFRVRFGESFSEACGSPNNDHSLHDFVAELPLYGTRTLGETGFRFVRLDAVEPGAWADLLGLFAVSSLPDLEAQGAFHSSDARLDGIWATGARTLRLCMQDYLWDGIKRDRLVWMGDLHPEIMTALAVFGGPAIVPASLDLVRDATILPTTMNDIPSYSLWWLVNQADWHLYRGDRAYLEGQRSYVLGLLDLMGGWVDGEGREAIPGFRFVDWPSLGDEAALAGGLQALMILAFDAGRRLCLALGDEARAARCRCDADRMRLAAPLPDRSKPAEALLVLAGARDPRRANEACLALDPLAGISTFMGYYVLEARALAGDVSGCLELIRRYWGGMLDLGATTFWEDFDLAWAHGAGRIDEPVPPGMADVHADFGSHCYKGFRMSLCHGWATGPTAWLSRHVLGFRPLGPGCLRASVRPDLGGLAWAKGVFPTPLGQVEVEHGLLSNGSIESRISAPGGMEIEKP